VAAPRGHEWSIARGRELRRQLLQLGQSGLHRLLVSRLSLELGKLLPVRLQRCVRLLQPGVLPFEFLKFGQGHLHCPVQFLQLCELLLEFA